MWKEALEAAFTAWPWTTFKRNKDKGIVEIAVGTAKGDDPEEEELSLFDHVEYFMLHKLPVAAFLGLMYKGSTITLHIADSTSEPTVLNLPALGNVALLIIAVIILPRRVLDFIFAPVRIVFTGAWKAYRGDACR